MILDNKDINRKAIHNILDINLKAILANMKTHNSSFKCQLAVNESTLPEKDLCKKLNNQRSYAILIYKSSFYFYSTT
jgi:hypothetical protein